MKPAWRIRTFISVALLTVVAVAAPLTQDLGQGLAYVRVHELPGDLPSQSEGRPPPCVIDIRYVQAEPDVATAFFAWVKFRASARSPIFVLANADTAEALLRPLVGHERGAGVVVIGAARRSFRPDLAVEISEEAERRAYNALEQGTPVTKLVTDYPDKIRNDEASLSKELPAPPAGEIAPAVPAAGRQAPTIDAALQRAMHLHRALVALKRI